MTKAESEQIAKDLKTVSDKMIQYSEKAQLDLFLNCYDDAPTFLHFSSDGKRRNHEEFKKICTEYYGELKEQKAVNRQEKIHVLDTDLAVLGWTGDIVAQFKNGEVMKMKDYSVTNLFKKFGNNWKVIHSHESALPPEIIK
jgi:hypothetical protein